MKLLFVRAAILEYDAAVRHYSGISRDLAIHFEDEVEKKLSFILRNPRVLSMREGNYRRANCRTFPYYLPYVIREDRIWILAVAHAARAPHYWKTRNREVS